MRVVVSILLLFATQMSAQIREPQPDAIIPTPDVTLKGEGPSDAVVVLEPRPGERQPRRRATATPQGTWELPAVALAPGVNTITVNINGQAHSVVVTHAEIRKLAQQKIFFQWKPGVDATLRRIAAKTLEPAPSLPEQIKFATDVKARTEDLTIATFEGVANVARVPGPGADTHTVLLTSALSDIYGQFDTTFDCMNSAPDDFSRVFVGYAAHRMIKDPDAWPMNRQQDSLALRTEDVAQVLARTAVHEIAHSLGLVGFKKGVQCQWMHGSDGGHTVPDDPPGAMRHGEGLFVMDEVPAEHFRLGYKTQGRADERLPIVFCNFNRSYLKLLLP